jgi:hypothetical protein
VRFQVTSGSITDTVEAGNEADAWAAFCDRHAEVAKHPKLNERVVAPLDAEPEPELEPVVEPEPVEPVAEPEPVTSELDGDAS